MAGLISEVTSMPIATVESRLRKEELNIGSSVRVAFEKSIKSSGAERHVYNDAMEHFYETTDSFLYELAIWNLNQLKQEMGVWCCDWITRHLGKCEVLSIGDGLGFECLRFARAGHEVTYFEVPGYCAEFAKKLFQNTHTMVTHLTSPKAIPEASSDAIICLDVLEHVEDPVAFLEVLKGYLRPGGVLIAHAPFYMIHPNYPTHVAASRKFSGDSSLYTNAGFRVLDGRAMWNPIVLQAPGGKRLPPAVLGKLRLLLGKPYLMTGRNSVRPFRILHGMKRKYQARFDH
ncbi:MAG: class I SAM-dependent methyltransferase [Akkermansiaceae bacterium]